MGMTNIDDVRVAWINKRLRIEGKAHKDTCGNAGTLRRATKELPGNFEPYDLHRCVTSSERYSGPNDLIGYGVTTYRQNAGKHLVKIADLIDCWIIGVPYER